MQKMPAKKNRIIMQGKYYDHIENKEMLLRVIGEESEKEFHVVTVYKTSNIEKYWKEDVVYLLSCTSRAASSTSYQSR